MVNESFTLYISAPVAATIESSDNLLSLIFIWATSMPEKYTAKSNSINYTTAIIDNVVTSDCFNCI